MNFTVKKFTLFSFRQPKKNKKKKQYFIILTRSACATSITQKLQFPGNVPQITNISKPKTSYMFQCFTSVQESNINGGQYYIINLLVLQSGITLHMF